MCEPDELTRDAALTRRRLLGAALGFGLLTSSAALLGPAHAAKLDKYGLDKQSRKIAPRGRVKCPAVKLEVYRGKHIRYRTAAKIYTGFRVRLERFEKVASDLAIEIYGRAPQRLVHMGTYNCRRIAAYPDWISEHGLGNAIDLEGFNFAALPRKSKLPAGLPKALRHAFHVRVLNHYKATRGIAKVHARFLRELGRRLIARKDIFRVLLGPGYPGHHNHFHFDCAPFRMVEGFAPPTK